VSVVTTVVTTVQMSVSRYDLPADPAWPDDAYAVIPTAAGLRRPPVGWWTVTHCELRRSYFSVRQLPNRNTLRGLRLGPACAPTSVRSTARRFIRNLAIAPRNKKGVTYIANVSSARMATSAPDMRN